MNILLCILPPVAPDTPSAGGAALAGALRDAGHSCRVWDANIALHSAYPDQHWCWRNAGWAFWNTPSSYASWLHETAYSLCKAIETGSQVDGLALSCVSAGHAFTQCALKAVRKYFPSLPVLLGGAAFFHEADVAAFSLPPRTSICVGEGERTLVHWVNRIGASRPNKRIFRRGLAHMDALPLPDFTPFVQSGYTRPDILPLESSRGCVNRCAFCDDAAMWSHYRMKSPDRIRRELQALRHLMRHATFCDSVMNPTPNRMYALAVHLAEYNITWDAMLQCTGVDMPLARALRGAGCTHIFLGVESFNPAFRSILGKNGTAQEAQSAIISLHEAGIRPSIGLIVAGPPLQSRDQFEGDLRSLEALAPYLDSVAVNPLCIPQGTPLWAARESLGIHLPHVTPWRCWHSGAGSADVAHRQQWCAEALALLRSLNIRVEEDIAPC